MTNLPPTKFSPEQITLMRFALDTAVHHIDSAHQTPATKANASIAILNVGRMNDGVEQEA